MIIPIRQLRVEDACISGVSFYRFRVGCVVVSLGDDRIHFAVVDKEIIRDLLWLDASRVGAVR
jgi:CRISPR/Cas system CMR-associated protein Cmr3 (group 5 of RAMP superfamily)